MPPAAPRSALRERASQRLHRALRRLVDVRPGEVGALLAAALFFFCLLAAYYLLRPLRDAMGLAGGADELPWLFGATFAVMLLAVPAFGGLAARLPPRRFVPIVYRFFAASFVGFGALAVAGVQPLWTARALFVWISVFNLFAVSVFWSVLADRFRADQGRRLYGFVAAGGTAGTLAGPALAAAGAALGPAALTLAAALLLELALRCLRRIEPQPGPAGAATAGARIGGGVFAGLGLIARSRFLQGIAVYMLLLTVTSTLLYVEQGRIVAAHFADTATRTRYFALLDLAVSGLTLLLQLGVTGRLLRRHGAVPALVALPIATALAFAGLALAPGVVALTVGQTVRRAVDYAVSRPAREILYIGVGREAKYKAKAVIETLVYRGGDAFAGALAAALAAAGVGFAALTLAALPVLGAWAVLGVRLGRREAITATLHEHEPAA